MIKNLFFDLDGTLADSREGVIGCFHHTISAVSDYAYSDEEIQAYIGVGIKKIFHDLLKTDSEEEVADAIRIYRKKYDEIGITGNTIYPGIRETLTALHDNGYRLFVVTNKNVIDATKIIKYLELNTLFSGVYGPDLQGFPDTKAKIIDLVLAEYGLNATETVMVGDRLQDIAAGKEAGTKTIGITWGFGSEEEVSDAGPDVICALPGEILQVIDGL